MDKKKAVKLATASAVAASAFVAANPHASQAATDVATVVSQAKAQMKQAYYTYSHTVTETGQFPDIKDVYAAYNKAKQAYANAVAVVNKAGGAKKDAYLADLQATYETYVFKANPKSGEARVATYIDAYNYATKLDAMRQELKAAVDAKDLKKAEELYHKISYELKTRTVILDRVYGQTTRELLRSTFKADAQALRDSLIYDITVAMKAREAQDAVKAGNLDKAKAALDQVNQYVSKVTDAFKAELQKAAQDANAAYEAALTPKVESVSAINLKQVKITFNKDVDVTTAETVGNYTFPSASGLTVTSAKANGKEVILTLTNRAAQQQTADLTIENVKTVNGELIGKTTKSVKFLDVTAPTVASVEAIGPKTLKVKFSEILSTVPTFTLDDGTIAIVNVAFTPGSDEAVLTLGTQPASGTHKLKVKDGADYAGFKVEEVVKEFTFATDATAPTVTVKSASPKKIVLEFNEDVTNVMDANVEFYHTYKGVAAYKATKTLNGRELTLDFANPLPEGPFKLFLSYVDEKGAQIADLWGNKVPAQTITGNVTVDTVAPTVTKVEAVSNTQIKVTFSEEVTGGDVLGNYTLKDAAGNTVNLTSVSTTDNKTFTITTPTLNGGSYTLTIKNVKDKSINENKLADYTTTVSVKDVVPPTVSDLDNNNTNGTQAQLLSAKKVKIVFSEVMDKASIENKLNYLFGGAALDSKVTVTAVDGNKAVILDFTDATQDPAGKTLQVLRVLDAAGNPIAAASTDVQVPSTVSAPLFDKAEATGKNTIKLYFKEIITGAQADDFEVSVDGGSTWAQAGGLSNEVVDGKSVITLTTTNSVNIPTNVQNVKVRTATSNVDAKNSFGAAVNLGTSGVTVADKYAPEMTAAVAKDLDGDNFVDTFEVTFSENLYVPSVNDSDFSIEGYTVKSVSVNGNVVTITVQEKTTNDLAAIPKVALVGPVEDAARNVKASQDGITATSADVAAVAAAKAALAIGYASGDDANNVTQDLTLPTTSNGATITWTSSNPSVVATDGKVTRPATGQSDATVTLTATITKGSATDTKTFTVTVKAQ
ncbi:immunoglobulin-like domain-containing protein [Geobacillus stearothermophilus]|uniref:immunoglobulin-like domain-containing protein n=1 Tax=Geobacillus stearothermophilus TaxID=1422 RepID=UPI002402C6F4|nr:immunoglobulin-like domain-containing protein [Geobacillus stearothermophilus]MDF9297786.1 Ig-like domain-containing protein [Geobacillus stearothermophilus]